MPVNPDFPFPQADRLSKVAVVIDAVGAGADTVSQIAEALGVVDRQGSYYVAAAGYLGLLERLDTAPVTYALTEDGATMLAAGPDARAALVLAAVADVPEVGIYLESALDGVTEYYRSAGLDAATARRRASTIASWTETVTGPGLSAAVTSTDSAAVTAAAATIRERVARRRSVTAPSPVTCAACYMTLPSTGVCENC